MTDSQSAEFITLVNELQVASRSKSTRLQHLLDNVNALLPKKCVVSMSDHGGLAVDVEVGSRAAEWRGEQAQRAAKHLFEAAEIWRVHEGGTVRFRKNRHESSDQLSV